MSMHVCILVGGGGTRLGKLTENTPKPLLTVAGVPFLDHLLADLQRYAVARVILLAGHCGDQVQRYAEGAGSRFPFPIDVVVEPTRRGTAGALWYAFDRLPDEFVLMNGDSYFGANIEAVRHLRRAGNFTAALALRHVDDVSRYGQVELRDGIVRRFGEKSGQGPGLVNGGVGAFSKAIFHYIDKVSSLENDVMPVLVGEGKVGGLECGGFFRDIGIPDDFARAQDEFARGWPTPVAFFDRDNTLIHDEGYTHKSTDLRWIDGSREAIRRLNDAGYRVCVVSNQAGVARGYYEEEDVRRFHALMQEDLAAFGAHIDLSLYCPHHPDGTVPGYAVACDCRKPKPGLLERAGAQMAVDKARSFLVGDKDSDIEAALAFGIRGIRYEGGPLTVLIDKALAPGCARIGQTCDR
jgi:D-glycero-D-manno-heptose 1,7-bisphosphate phosphatase